MALSCLPVGGTGALADILSHRALYNLSLASVKPGADVTSVEGDFVAEWNQACDGWTYSHYLIFNVTGLEDDTVNVRSSFTSWEAKDGRTYRFNLRDETNGEVTNKIVGQVRIAPRSARGTAEFELPESKTVDLPPGTIFPAAHTLQILQGALHGDRVVTRTVFDGMSEDGAFEISVVIGDPTAAAPKMPPGLEALSDRKGWPLQVGYFAIGSTAAVPEHELSLRLYEGGVENNMVVDFGDFRLRAVAVRIEPLPQTDCAK